MNECLNLHYCELIISAKKINAILKATHYVEVEMAYDYTHYLPDRREQSDLLFNMEHLQKGSPYYQCCEPTFDFDDMDKFLVDKNCNELLMVFPTFIAKIKLDWFLNKTQTLEDLWDHYYDGICY